MSSQRAKLPLNRQRFDVSQQAMPDATEWHTATQLVRGGTLRSDFGETSEAIFLNSGFVYDSPETAERRFNGEEPGFVYSRYLNPTLEALHTRLSLLEAGPAAAQWRSTAMASGMAAVFASMMCFLRAGDHVLASRALFGSCHYILTELLPRYGMEVTLVDGRDIKAFERGFRKNTRAVFIESPSNPTLELVDIAALGKLCKANNARFIVDNIFASPILQKPLTLGADIIVYSTTKHMDGQGRTLGGAVIASEEFTAEHLLPFHRHTGPAMSPFNAWVVLKGLETLELRIARHVENATAVAEFLESHPKVARVIYPGLPSHPQASLAKQQMLGGGSMLAFELKDGKKAAFAMMNKLRVVDISNNLGDAKSLITHPASTTHSNMTPEAQMEVGITPGLMRLSVGLEDKRDLIKDFEQAIA